MFGRKGLDKGPTRTLRDTIDLDNPDDIAWVKETGDPLIWHSVAQSILIFRGDPHDFLAWLVEQETLDRTTAAMMFLAKNNGPDYLLDGRLPPEEIGGWMGEDQARTNHMIERLCELDKTHTFQTNGIGLPKGWEQGRRELSAELLAHPRFPKNLMSQPIPGEGMDMPYVDIGEGDLFSVSHHKELFPFLYD